MPHKIDTDISHEQAKIISQKRYKDTGCQQAFYAGWMECAKRADVVIMDVMTHCAKNENKFIKALEEIVAYVTPKR